MVLETSLRNYALPREITDRIIDDLREFPEALNACALVCSLWRPRSQWNIFRSISVMDKTLGFQSSSVSKMFDRLLACLRGSPGIGSFIEDLTIDCEERPDLAFSFIENLYRFPRLRVLCIRWLVLPRGLASRMDLEKFGRCIAQSAIRNLQSLTLHRVSFPGAYLHQFLDETHLHNLNHLAMYMVQVYDTDFLTNSGYHLPPPISGLNPTSLKTLRVSSAGSAATAMRKLLVQFGAHLRGLQTLYCDDKDAAVLGQILRNSRLSLETLEVRLYPSASFKFLEILLLQLTLTL